MAIVAARFWAALKPLARPAMTMLAASRLTSHSQGPGSVSSKSLASNTRRRSGEANRPKLEQVGVAAGLHDDVGPGRGGEVEGHHRGGAAVVGEGRLGHARVAQRDEVGQPVGLLALEDGDRVTAGPGLEGGVAGARHALAGQAALLLAHADGWTHGRAVQASPDGGSGAQASS